MGSIGQLLRATGYSMSNQTSNMPIEITTLCLNERTTNMFEMFFRGPCRGRFRLAHHDQAQLAIIDLDTVGSDKALQRYRSDFPQKPVLGITVKNLAVDGIQLLKKPIKLQDLEKSILHIYEKWQQQSAPSPAQPSAPEPAPKEPFKHALSEPLAQPMESSDNALSLDADTHPLALLPEEQEATVSEAQATESKASTSSEKIANLKTRSATIAFENQKKLLHECCGSMPDIPPENPEAGEKLFYHPERYLQQIVQKAIAEAKREQKVAQLEIPGNGKLLILPQSQCIITSLNDRSLRLRTFLEAGAGDITMRLLDESEEQLKKGAAVTTPIDAFLWKLTLWSARGRLPEGTDLHQPLRLRRWPNFTRLLGIPQFLRIAAYWSETSDSLLHTVEILSIEQRFVFSFYSACLVLGLIEQTQDNSRSTPAKEGTQKKRKQQRSLMGRLLTHLRRGAGG
jgi:hypothetical protein